jgi:GT2 family glycosyltransferase
MHPGEDMVLSIELIQKGFASGLIPDAFVYHKRRTSLRRFFKQVYGFGKTRVIISKIYPDTFNLFFLAPALFLAGSVGLVLLTAIAGLWALLPILIWMVLIFLDSTIKNASIITGAIAVIASFIQLYGYGAGFLKAVWSVFILHKDEYGVFAKGFYPRRLTAD